MSRRRAAAFAFLGTGANTLLISLQAIVLIPLYLRAIGPTVYGAWLASGDMLIWLQAFDLGLPNFIIQRIGRAHARGDRAAIGPHFTTAVIVLAAVGCAFALVAVTGAPSLAALVGVPAADQTTFVGCFRLAATATALLLVNNAVIGLARGIQQVAFLSAATVTGTAVGLLTSMYGIFAGWGLWAIAIGITARVTVLIGASLWFLVTVYSPLLRGHLWPRSALLQEFAAVTPATAAGGAAYSLASQSENFLIAILLRPEAVPIYNLTKKAAEMIRAVLDTVGHASYGGFAHLASSPDRHRAWGVYQEIKGIRLMLATAGAAAFISVNQSLMSVWVGDQFFGGFVLTVLIGVQLVLAGHAYLLNYLYRAAGSITVGSVALVVEGAVRVIVTGLLIRTIGIVGAPLGAILTSLPASALYDRWIRQSLPIDPSRGVTSIRGLLLVVVAIAIASAVAWSFHVPSWSYVIGMGAVASAVTAGLLLTLDTTLSSSRLALVKSASAVTNFFSPSPK